MSSLSDLRTRVPTNHKSFDDNSNDDDGDELMSTIFMSRRWRYKLYELPPNIREMKCTSCVGVRRILSVPGLPGLLGFSTRATPKPRAVEILSSVRVELDFACQSGISC
jgi:hypothetical protein